MVSIISRKIVLRNHCGELRRQALKEWDAFYNFPKLLLKHVRQRQHLQDQRALSGAFVSPIKTQEGGTQQIFMLGKKCKLFDTIFN